MPGKNSWLSTTRKLVALTLVVAAFLPLPIARANILGKLKPHPQTKPDALDSYLATARQSVIAAKPNIGSLWNPDGRLSDIGTDAKARYKGDVVEIALAESTTSALQGSVQTARTFSASSGISAFFGLPAATSPAGNMFSPTSSQTLNGKGQTALSTTLNTTLAANVIEVLPNGQLVIEASRDVEVTDQHQTMILRGIVRTQDISPANIVASAAISHLEVSLRGKGVITEGTHPPNSILRLVLRVVGF